MHIESYRCIWHIVTPAQHLALLWLGCWHTLWEVALANYSGLGCNRSDIEMGPYDGALE